MWQKHKRVRHEARKFSFVGIIVTTIDFVLLNVGTAVFHLPLITANIISTTITSILSFRLNKKLTFSGQRHGHVRTIVRYTLIVGTSVYVIQNMVLYVIGSHFDYPTNAVLSLLERAGMPDVNTQLVSNNVAKALAAFIASIWNFFLLRRFVFVPGSHAERDDEKEYNRSTN